MISGTCVVPRPRMGRVCEPSLSIKNLKCGWLAQDSRHHTCTCFSNQLQNINLYLFLLHLPFFITFITPLEHRRAPQHFLSTSLTYRNFYFINHSVCLLDTTMLLIQILTNNSIFFMRISFSASIFVLIIQYVLWIRLRF